MKKLVDNIWVHDDAMSLMGAQLRLRMTAVKLASGKIWIHSPTKISASLKKEVEELGEVGFIVGPSNGHNLWLSEWIAAFPQAAVYVSGGIPGKLKLTNYQLLDENINKIWPDDFNHDYMSGVPFFNESLFLHEKTRSLIVTDFIQNHSGEGGKGLSGVINKCLFQPMGFKGKCLAPPLKLKFMIKQKKEFVSFIERIKKWEFDRIIVTHGDIIESNAKQTFDELCDFLLKKYAGS